MVNSFNSGFQVAFSGGLVGSTLDLVPGLLGGTVGLSAVLANEF